MNNINNKIDTLTEINFNDLRIRYAEELKKIIAIEIQDAYNRGFDAGRLSGDKVEIETVIKELKECRQQLWNTLEILDRQETQWNRINRQ